MSNLTKGHYPAGSESPDREPPAGPSNSAGPTPKDFKMQTQEDGAHTGAVDGLRLDAEKYLQEYVIEMEAWHDSPLGDLKKDVTRLFGERMQSGVDSTFKLISNELRGFISRYEKDLQEESSSPAAAKELDDVERTLPYAPQMEKNLTEADIKRLEEEMLRESLVVLGEAENKINKYLEAKRAGR